MNDTELIEDLTQIIIRQAAIIQKLHGIVKQLNATTSIDGEVALILDEAKKATAGRVNQCGLNI